FASIPGAPSPRGRVRVKAASGVRFRAPIMVCRRAAGFGGGGGGGDALPRRADRRSGRASRLRIDVRDAARGRATGRGGRAADRRPWLERQALPGTGVAPAGDRGLSRPPGAPTAAAA